MLDLKLPLSKLPYTITEECTRAGACVRSITHFVCGTVSYNHNDVAQHYCPKCHQFLDEVSDAKDVSDVRAGSSNA